MQNVNTLCIAAQSPQGKRSTYGIVQRTQSDWAANGIRSDGGRNLIGWRTESDWTADAIRLGGGRNPMAEGALSGGTLRGCTCLKCTNQADGERVPTEYAEHTEHSGRESLPQIDTDTHRLGGYGIPAIPTPPITQPNHLWKSVKSVGEYDHAHNQADGERVPTEYAEHTEPSGRESLPQIGTDTHRLGGYGIPAIPTPPITQPNILWIPWENILHQKLP